MQIDADQIVNLPFADIEELIARAADAERDFANCAAALLFAERTVRRSRRAFLFATAAAGVLFWVAVAGWCR